MRSDAEKDSQAPDLLERVHDLTLALKGLVAATGDASSSNQEQALAKAQDVLSNSKSRPRSTASD